MSNKALIHVKISRHPISEQIIGFRLEAAIPNMDGRVMKARKDGDSTAFYATDERAPSFRKPYLIEQTGDYGRISKDKIDRFMDRLKWEGFKDFELIGKYQGEPLSEFYSTEG